MTSFSLRALTASVPLALALIAALALPSAAFGDAPPVTTTSVTTFTMPVVPSGTDHLEVRVNLRTVPSELATSVRLTCDGHDPYLFDRVVSGTPGVVSYDFIGWPELGGARCSVRGQSSIGSQTVDFFPGVAVTVEHGAPMVTIEGLVVIHSSRGGIL
ncbi:hypothetical protein B7R22_10625 [Subtercola boreus]|uniref:Uncharacterized protein n=1 Tax=Subtercola boreus TaxID=120213 RepID=A0A3E0VXL0_9MICO|nr:hypothetical protein [Subtercola boreus]RFA14063.1 hypothetical protein B7R22_10625 [Subtercola boreus]